MGTKNIPPTRICDLEFTSYAAPARADTLHNRREQDVIEAYRRGGSIESLQRMSGYHPQHIWAILNLHRGTPEAEAQYQKILSLYHHMRAITERDDL
jgi:hypothetical protein